MSIGKLKKNSELNDRHQKMSSIAHQIAEQSIPQIWNVAAEYLNKFTPMSGDEGLSMMTTLLGDFVARFLVEMKNLIVDHDETGYSLEELQQTLFHLVSDMLKIKQPISKPIQKNEFKKLN